MPSEISPGDARSLLEDWVSSTSLRRHCLAVSAAMQAYAERDGHDAALWATTGLLHDADYERFPDMDDAEHGHPRTIMAELERRDAPPEMVRAIASHADYLGVQPESPIERTLVAVDELCGFLVACAQVRPEGIHGLTPKSVKKKLKQPSFAAAVDRDDVRGGAERLEVDFDEHVAFVIAALEARADELDLHGRVAAE
jgi:putative nucleotidyltransferase with HDIG domain